LEGLTPLGYEPDLFEPETETANRKIQEAVDKIQLRFGEGKITRGLVLAASGGEPRLSASAAGSLMGGKRLITAGAGYGN
jgi:hypothetical protein